MNGQLEFSIIVSLLADMAAEKAESLRTWFLLYHRDNSDELRAELSLPVGIAENRVVETWAERIILPPRTFGADLRLPKDAGGDDGVEFDIAVR